jgi:hypothetical protein
MKRKKVTSLPDEVRQISFFDPQFFLPESNRGNLSTYEFFPDVVADGFSTSDYDAVAAKSAELCVKFQVENQFRYCVIPTRCYEGIPDDFIDSQSTLFIRPFLKACEQIYLRQPLILQLILNDHMLKNADFRNEVLNWTTGIPELDGIYLIPYITNRSRKQIGDIDLLLTLFRFIDAIRSNEMDIIVGYLNTESIPLLAALPSGITMGSYENLRMFRLTAYEEKKDQQMRGPIPRIYIPQLLQWMDHRYLGAMLEIVDDPAAFLGKTEYKDLMFQPEYNWHFQKSEPYMHYFVGFSNQVDLLSPLSGKERVDRIVEICHSALDKFRMFEENGLAFDVNSDSSHLPLWLSALNIYGKEKGFTT